MNDDYDWREDARCAQTDPDAFFPEPGGTTKNVKAICARCPVALECLLWAIDNNVHEGIWGGVTAFERRKMRAEA